MTSRFLVPTLAALAAVPAAQAFEIAADAWTLSIEPRIQTRMEFQSASDAAGDDWDIYEERTTENPQALNFQVRRARIYFKGEHEDGWKFNYTIYNDQVGLEDSRDEGSRGLRLRYAWVGKEIQAGDIEHYLQFGIDKHTASMADVDSSSKMLFPTGRLGAAFAGPRSVGLDYSLTHPVFNLRAGIADEAEDENNDWHVFARVATCLKEEWKVKRSESWLGKEGFGHELGLGVDFKTDGSDDSDGTEDDDYSVFFLDYIIHYNEISGLAELSFISRGEASTKGGGAGDTGGMIFTAQAGYALPQANGTVVEPALRVQFADLDDDNDDEGVPYSGGEEMGGGGIYFSAGVNYYIDGHSNKFQAAVQSYTPEEGDADAVIFRLAHQLDF